MSHGWGSHHDEDEDYRLNLLLWLLAEQAHTTNTKVPEWALNLEDRIDQKLGSMMATLAEALDGWKAYVADLKSQLATAVSGLTEAQAAAQSAADALAAFQADDAATDAAQLAAQAQADADAVQAALDEVKNPVEPPPVIDEPIDPPVVEEPPVDVPVEPAPVEEPPADVPPVE